MSTFIDKAIFFATEKHSGQVRKFHATPYILHPLEVASIIASVTEDENVICAGILHDTIEDCGATPEEIINNFGPAVYDLVSSETEDKMSDLPPSETWMERKDRSLLELKNTADINVKILWLADKLSNVRSFYKTYLEIGDDLWLSLHQKDKSKQEWYYRRIMECIPELSDTLAYSEYALLLDKLFGGDVK